MDLGWFETSLDVKDIERSIAFYEQIGFQFVEGAAELRTVTLNRGDCRLTLFQDTLDPAETQLIFWQGDVATVASDLASRGVTFARPLSTDKDGTSVMLMDPDGHPLFLISMPVHFVGQPGYEREAP